MDYDNIIDDYDDAYQLYQVNTYMIGNEQGGDIEGTRKWILNQLLHNKEIISIDRNILVTESPDTINAGYANK